jgi:hypothetical protein
VRAAVRAVSAKSTRSGEIENDPATAGADNASSVARPVTAGMNLLASTGTAQYVTVTVIESLYVPVGAPWLNVLSGSWP